MQGQRKFRNRGSSVLIQPGPGGRQLFFTMARRRAVRLAARARRRLPLPSSRRSWAQHRHASAQYWRGGSTRSGSPARPEKRSPTRNSRRSKQAAAPRRRPSSEASDESRNISGHRQPDRPPRTTPSGGMPKSSRPKNVATPLPPLKPSHTGKRWPMKAQAPAVSEVDCAGGPPASQRAIISAMPRLAGVEHKVVSARSLRPVRRTLVAPILPEPMERMSPRPRGAHDHPERNRAEQIAAKSGEDEWKRQHPHVSNRLGRSCGVATFAADRLS